MNTILYVGEHSRTFDVRWHSHDHWELVYCTGGIGTFQLESGLTISYHVGQAVAIPPGIIHMNTSAVGFTNIHLTMDAPAFPYKDAFIVDDDAEGHMGSAFTQARFYFQSDIRKQEMVLSALGELINSYMIVFRDNKEFSEPVEAIKRSIIDNVSNAHYELDEEIRQMPFNYDYLRKLFQKEMGLTPLKYMTNLRMKKAKSMLTAARMREYSVAEVSAECGFSDALYFSRVFKKYYGCSPSEFAKDFRSDEADPLTP